jgi:hypothetical protein
MFSLAAGHNLLTFAAGTVVLISRICGEPTLCASTIGVPEDGRNMRPANIVHLTISLPDRRAENRSWIATSGGAHRPFLISITACSFR